MKEIIFVCTGNTCRSPLAESYAKTMYEDFTFSSRGLFVMSRETSINSLKIIEREHLYFPSLPKQLSLEDIENAVLLTMTEDHKRQILNQEPQAKVLTIGEAAGEYQDVSDPFGGSESDYEYTFSELRRLIDKIDFETVIF